MTALETIKKLIAYAERKRRLRDPETLALEGESPLRYSRELRRLKKELLAGGIDPQLLELSGDEIAQVIHESLMKRGYA